MNSSRFPITVESVLYLGLAGLALALRLYALGSQPLTDAEAHDALAAYRFLQGSRESAAVPQPEPLPSSPLLFSLASLAFLVFGASDATARLAPALAGGLLVLTPAFFRRELGPLAALGTAALLTISPVLIGTARMADAAMPVALAALTGLGALNEYRHTGKTAWLYAAAAAGGAALAAGPWALTLALILAGTAVLWRLLDAAGAAGWLQRLRSAGTPDWAAGGLAAMGVGAFVVSASAMLLYRPGLAAAAQAIPAWLAGWRPNPAGWVWLHAPAVLAVYDPFTTFLGIAGMVSLARPRGQAPRVGWLLAAWALAGLAVNLAYSGASAADVAWIVLPLAGLGGLWLVELISGNWDEIDAAAVAIQAALVLLLVGYSGLNVAAFGQAERSLSGQAPANLILALVSLALVVLVSVLFGVGWSAATAVRGFSLGVGLALFFAGLSATGRLVAWGEAPEVAGELWHAGAPAPLAGLRLMTSTLEDVSGQAVGAPHDLSVVVNGAPEGALAWALREFRQTTYVDSLAASIAAPIVIAPADQATPELGSAYAGQSFAVRGWLDVNARGPLDWLNWLAFRRQPTTTDSVVLWVRSDLRFDEGTAQTD
jgi:uncharacterized protein (TIGR03663 family)